MKKAGAAPQRGLSLYRVVLASFLLTIGVLLIFVGLMLTPRVSTLLEQNAVERTRETTQQSTNSLEIYISNMMQTLHFASGLLPEGPEMDGALFQSQITLLQQSQRDIRNIAFFGADGALLHGTSTALAVPPEAIRDADWFAQAIAREGAVPYCSAPHVQHVFQGHHEWVITLAKSASYEQGGLSRTGVLLMDIDFSALSSVADDAALGSSGYVYIIDEHDRIVYHPRQQLLYAGLADEDLRAVAEQVVGVCRDEQAGRERVLIINTVSQTRWRLVGVAYIDEILALQSALLRMITIAMVCGGLLSIAAATVTAFFVTRPIRQLQDKMRQVEEGDLHTAIDVRGFTEIRALSTSFTHMLERIRGLMAQIVSEQEAKRLHELNALQAQINPHFLYNTLDSIIWMEERGRSREAITMVSALARLFRISISKGRNIISVREELEHVRNYLIIQKMRFRNKFTYVIDAQEAALSCNTVKLIVQPIVENAVHHAIDAYDEQVLHILVTARLEGDALEISVIDDGTGIDPDRLQNILQMPPGKSGIGLRNVHERIQLTCGRAYGLRVQSEEDVGTTVVIRLPARMEGTP